jgi:hypothetical protein
VNEISQAELWAWFEALGGNLPDPPPYKAPAEEPAGVVLIGTIPASAPYSPPDWEPVE